MIETRFANTNDVFELQKIYKSAYRENRDLGFPCTAEDATVEEISSWFENDLIWVAEENKKIIGTVRLKNPNSDCPELCRLAVNPNCKRGGIGKLLMDIVEDHVIKSGKDKIQLLAAKDHPFLCKFYKSRNYKFIKIVPFDGYEDILMEKKLTSFWNQHLNKLVLVAVFFGFILGWFFPQILDFISPIGKIYLNLLKVVVLPLIFFSIVLSLLKLESGDELKNLGIKTLSYYLMTSCLAALTGVVLYKLFGVGDVPVSLSAIETSNSKTFSISEAIVNIFPSNIFKSFADGNIIQILIFSFLIGLSGIFLKSKMAKDSLEGFFNTAHDLILLAVRFIIILTPIGVIPLIAEATTALKAYPINELGGFFLVTGICVLLHSFGTLPFLMWFFTKENPYKYMFKVRSPLIVSLFTASSSATLPVSMKAASEAGISQKTFGFTLPLGATLNMDGSALYQAIIVLFLARLAGLPLDASQQVMVVVITMLSSAGTAGIPGGGVALVSMMLDMFQIPQTFLGIYILVDRFWDYPVTAVNVWGDLAATKIIDKWMKKS